MGAARRKQIITRTFTSNTTFVMPTGVTILTVASGKGAAGSPGNPGTTEKYTRIVNTQYRRDGGTDVQTGNVSGWPYGSAQYCENVYYTPEQSTVYYGVQTCYYPSTRTVGGSSPTTGASASAFGKTFPGGTGGAATTTTYPNVAVNPGTSYSVIVPSGGLITITYEV